MAVNGRASNGALPFSFFLKGLALQTIQMTTTNKLKSTVELISYYMFRTGLVIRGDSKMYIGEGSFCKYIVNT